MRRKFKKLGLLGTLALLIASISGTATAHGPEYHIENNLCTRDNLLQWQEQSTYCDPDNPANLTLGITHSSHPNGLCYPSFNNFNDAVDKITGLGMDPYGTNPPIFKNEKDFVKVSTEMTPEGKFPAETFTNLVQVEDGDVVQVLIYMHNDGDPCFNDNVNVPQGEFFSDWNTTSYNTRLNFGSDFTIEDGSAYTILENGKGILGHIWSDNAVNRQGVVGGKTSDGVILGNPSGETLKLEYVPGSALYVDMRDDAGYEWWWYEHDILNPLDLFTEEGWEVSTLDGISGSVKGSGGDYYASEPYTTIVRFQLKASVVEPPEQPEPVCISLDADFSQATVNGKNGYDIEIIDIEFANEVPVDLNYQYSSVDTDGAFSVNGFGPYQSVSAQIQQKVQFIGKGPVNVSIKGYEKFCSDTIYLPQEKPQECHELLVNHHETIFADYVSEFKAKAIEIDEDNYNGKITYTVEEGYGYFYTTKPSGTILDNYVEEFDDNEVVPIPDGGFCGPSYTNPPVVEDQPDNNNNGKVDDLIFDIVLGNVQDEEDLTQYGGIFDTFFEDVDVKEVPEWWETGLFIDPLDTDPSPEKIGPAWQSSQIPGGEKLNQYNIPQSSQQNVEEFSSSPANFGLNSIFDVNLDEVTTVEDLIQEDLQTLFTAFPSGTSITVNPGTKVYFVGYKAGENKIKVETECTDEKACVRYFDIKANTNICAASTLNIATPTKSVPACLAENGTYLMSQDFYSDAAKTQKISSSLTKVKWESTDPNGVFYEMTDAAFGLPTPQSSPYIGSQYVKYEGGGQVTGTLYSVAGDLVAGNTACSEVIGPCENGCAELNVYSSLGTPISINDLENGSTAFLTLEAKDLEGKTLPSNTKIKWSTDTKADLIYKGLGVDPVSGDQLNLTLKQSPVQLEKGDDEISTGRSRSKRSTLLSSLCCRNSSTRQSSL